MLASSLVEVPESLLNDARSRVKPHVHHTPLLSSHLLSKHTGLDVWLKAEMFQRTGSYKIRGPLNKFAQLTEAERRRGVVCSSAGNHAQGVALAASMYGMPAVVVMAENATPSKVDATRAYGAEVVLYGSIWDEANAKAVDISREKGLTYIHPFDDLDLIAGQATLGLELCDDLPEADVVIVPIGGGGLISGVALAMKMHNPGIRIVGVESSGAPGMKQSVEAGEVVTLDDIDCVIDGLKVKRVGEVTFRIISQLVDEIVTVPDREIFEALLWTMHHCKLVVEGAGAAPVAALLQGLVAGPADTKAICVLSGGNVNLEQLRGLTWN